MLSPDEIRSFRSELLSWFSAHGRDLAWRRTRDPYAIWISEVMLQQTRVTAVVPFYERFLARFPTITHLAEAPEQDLLAHWAGLGYYYRARNLQKAAQRIVQNNVFPSSYEAIRALPGVGDYTAAAVASIAFNLPHAVVDGNVFRVLSRVLDDDTNITGNAGRKHFAKLADAFLDREQSGNYNQAVMELGATVCLQKNPQCLLCPVSSVCRVARTGRQNDLPVKIIDRKSVEERRDLLWIERAGELLCWQRPPEARLMPGFWELPEITDLPDAMLRAEIGTFRHGITFHNYRFRVWEAGLPAQAGRCQWLPLAAMEERPISTVFRKAIRLVTKRRNGTETTRRAAASTL